MEGSLEARISNTRQSMDRQLPDHKIPVSRQLKLTAIQGALSRPVDLAGKAIPVYVSILFSRGQAFVDVSWVAGDVRVTKIRFVNKGGSHIELDVPDADMKENDRIAKSVVCFDASIPIDVQAAKQMIAADKPSSVTLELLLGDSVVGVSAQLPLGSVEDPR